MLFIATYSKVAKYTQHLIQFLLIEEILRVKMEARLTCDKSEGRPVCPKK